MVVTNGKLYMFIPVFGDPFVRSQQKRLVGCFVVFSGKGGGRRNEKAVFSLLYSN